MRDKVVDCLKKEICDSSSNSHMHCHSLILGIEGKHERDKIWDDQNQAAKSSTISHSL